MMSQVMPVDVARDIPLPARAGDPDTSAHAVNRKTLEEQYRRLLAILSEGPRTDTDLYTAYRLRFGMISPSGCRTRRSELVAVGKVVDTNARNMLPSGRQSIVWGIKEVK